MPRLRAFGRPWQGAIALLLVLGCAAPARAQAVGPDGVPLLLGRLERTLLTSDASRFPSLLSPNAAPGLHERLGAKLFMPATIRAVVRERDRAALDGALPGDGYRLVVEMMTETHATARVLTARLDVRRAPGDLSPDAWRIVSGQLLTVVEGLFRLEVDATRQFAARNLRITSEDLTLTLADGAVFVVNSERGTTALVLIGHGEMVFTPRPRTERDQLRLFAGGETLTASFEFALVKVNPEDFRVGLQDPALSAVAVDPRLLRRARDLFEDDAHRSFSLDLGDLSAETWYLLPPSGDLLAEVRTKGHGALTYARSVSEAEDVSLFERAKGRDIARYASVERLRTRGPFYNEDDLGDYDVLDYDVDVSVSPEREFLDARARIRIKVRAQATGTLNVKLAEPLAVSTVTSPELGRLTFFRVRTRDTVVVNLPVALRRDTEVTIAFSYKGRLATQSIDTESLQLPQDVGQSSSTPKYYLLSSRSYWYPQPATGNYATATIRVTVPDGFGCVGTGEPTPGFRAAVSSSGDASKVYAYRVLDRVRHLAILVGRFKTAASSVLPLVDDLAPAPESLVSADGARLPGFRVRDRVAVSTEAATYLQARGRELNGWASNILRFYTSLLGEAPYPSLTVAAVEHPLPGGHSPAYFVMLHNPSPATPIVWRNDPAYFQSFPEFFLAHELAHQWWGQAVGWKNYHEQWISEGFAQYFAALYAQQKHGPEAFGQMLRQFRKWSMDTADQGPVYLGYRLGQIRGDRRVFRAIVYNKGAAVLHMLRGLVGDDAFFASLRRLYDQRKFEKAGTDDVRLAFEAETGRSLGRFFDRWIFESGVPRIRVKSTVGDHDVLVRFQQLQDVVFDLPVTVTVTYADGREQDVVVPVTEAVVERHIPTDGPVRGVRVNRDSAALAEFEE